MARITCPACGRPLNVADNATGTWVQCRNCATVFIPRAPARLATRLLLVSRSVGGHRALRDFARAVWRFMSRAAAAVLRQPLRTLGYPPRSVGAK